MSGGAKHLVEEGGELGLVCKRRTKQKDTKKSARRETRNTARRGRQARRRAGERACTSKLCWQEASKHTHARTNDAVLVGVELGEERVDVVVGVVERWQARQASRSERRGRVEGQG